MKNILRNRRIWYYDTVDKAWDWTYPGEPLADTDKYRDVGLKVFTVVGLICLVVTMILW